MFVQVGAPRCQMIVAAGAMAGLLVSMFGSMFPMPRIIYSMAQDGLLFKWASETRVDDFFFVYSRKITNLYSRLRQLQSISSSFLSRNIFFIVYRSLSQIFPLTGTPVVATVLSGVASAVAALVINLDTLIEMMSIGKYVGRLG